MNQRVVAVVMCIANQYVFAVIIMHPAICGRLAIDCFVLIHKADAIGMAVFFFCHGYKTPHNSGVGISFVQQCFIMDIKTTAIGGGQE